MDASKMVQRRAKERILAIFANPHGSDPLRLGEEDRVLHECLRGARSRKLHLEVRHAATVHDLRRALLEETAHVVHFSGHGTGHGLVFEDETGNPKLIPPAALTELLSAYAPPLHTVVLNACYSNVHARSFEGVPFAIVMQHAVADRAAIEFARGFYDALAAGRDTEFAYFEGLRTLKLLDLSNQDTPQLIKNGSLVSQQRKQEMPEALETPGWPVTPQTPDTSEVDQPATAPPRLRAEFERRATPPHDVVANKYGRKHFSIRLYVASPPPQAVRVEYQLHQSFEKRVRVVWKLDKPDFTEWIETYGDFEICVLFFDARKKNPISWMREYVTEALRYHYGADIDEAAARALDVIRDN
jgi:hypothetical protein